MHSVFLFFILLSIECSGTFKPGPPDVGDYHREDIFTFIGPDIFNVVETVHNLAKNVHCGLIINRMREDTEEICSAPPSPSFNAIISNAYMFPENQAFTFLQCAFSPSYVLFLRVRGPIRPKDLAPYTVQGFMGISPHTSPIFLRRVFYEPKMPGITPLPLRQTSHFFRCMKAQAALSLNVVDQVNYAQRECHTTSEHATSENATNGHATSGCATLDHDARKYHAPLPDN